MLYTLKQDAKISPPMQGDGGIVVRAIFLGFNEDRRLSEDEVWIWQTGTGLKPEFKYGDRSGNIVVFGQPTVYEEFTASHSNRARQWHTQLDKLSLDKKVTALAELTRDFDTSKEVGGPIDTVKLTATGVHWATVKPQCR